MTQRNSGERFGYPSWSPFLTGAGIARVSTALGVGLLPVPYTTLVLDLSMFMVTGTVEPAITVSLVTSIARHVWLGVRLDVPLPLLLLADTVTDGSEAPCRVVK